MQLVDLRRSVEDNKFGWLPPFDDTAVYANEHWWDEPRYYYDAPWFIQVLDSDGTEVARVELLDPGEVNLSYTDAERIGGSPLEICFFEVAQNAQGRGHGTAVVKALEQRFPDRVLLAYANTDVPEFWASLGWARFDHRDGDIEYRPMFVRDPKL
ncbi:GNAT family N-acetyltransferase [Gordonia malaquae]|uniref:GNAT family N-acetyltransferase n=1 Tax=Gordonia malaquae TaxID=410332 RepID=UPI003017C5FC